MRIGLHRMGIPLAGFASLPEITRACGLNVIPYANPNSAEFVRQVQLLGVQLIVVASFSHILRRALIDTPELGCINVHPSLLPRYRGPEPLYWVLANREKTTGVTLHYMDEGIDSGDIILQRELEIRPKETETTLLQRSSAIAAELLHEAVPLLQAGHAPRNRQDPRVATYYSFPSKGASLPKRQRGLP
jgi:methionyl-tRNA formyltransferase